jgi:hypothetical protein
MVFREIDAPLEHVGVHGSGSTFMFDGGDRHPVPSLQASSETLTVTALSNVAARSPEVKFPSWSIRPASRFAPKTIAESEQDSRTYPRWWRRTNMSAQHGG